MPGSRLDTQAEGIGYGSVCNNSKASLAGFLANHSHGDT